MSTKSTGFASPAQGYEEQGIDLNRLLIKNPAATYFVRMDSDDMAALGLPQGSLLVIDRSKDPFPNCFAIISHEGRFLCRKMLKNRGRVTFTNGVKEINPISDETEILGVVTASIKEFSNGTRTEAIF